MALFFSKDEIFACPRCQKSKFTQITVMILKKHGEKDLSEYESRESLMCIGCNHTIDISEFGEKHLHKLGGR